MDVPDRAMNCQTPASCTLATYHRQVGVIDAMSLHRLQPVMHRQFAFLRCHPADPEMLALTSIIRDDRLSMTHCCGRCLSRLALFCTPPCYMTPRQVSLNAREVMRRVN